MFDPPGLPPAGWYPDPERHGATRWWTGTQWASPTLPSSNSSAWSGRSDSLPDVGQLLADAFKRMLRRWRALTVISVVTGGISWVAALFGLRALVDDLALIDNELVGWSDDRIPAVVTLLLVAGAAGWIGVVATTWLLLRDVDHTEAAGASGVDHASATLTTGAEVGAGMRALTASLRILPRMIAWSLALVLASLLTLGAVVGLTLVVPLLGVLLILALIPVAVWVAIKLAFFTHAVVDRPGNPFARSASVSAGRFWPTLGRLLLLGVVAGAISWGISVATSLAGVGSGFPEATVTFETGQSAEFQDDVDLEELFAGSAPAIVVSVIGGVITSVLATSVVTSGLAQMYRTRNPPDT